MRIFVYTTFLLSVFLSNSAYAACVFNKANYKRAYKDKYILEVRRDNSLKQVSNYICYISYTHYNSGYSNNIYRCSENISLSETIFTNSSGYYSQETWVLIDKNENTFVLKSTFNTASEVYPISDDCSSMINISMNEFKFSENINYSKNALFRFYQHQHYTIKENKHIKPVF